MNDLIEAAHRAHELWRVRTLSAHVPAPGGQIVNFDDQNYVVLSNHAGPVAIYRIEGDRLRDADDAVAIRT
jgi:hypothetical protein